jgi:16S rRNA (guanine1207-N2)-methyltransferase
MPQTDPFAPMIDCLEAIGLPTTGQAVFLNAAPDPRLAALLPPERLICRTPHKGRHDALAASGYDMNAIPEPGKAKLVLLRLPRDAAELRGLFAEALHLAEANAPIIIFAGNDEGIRSFEKLLGRLQPLAAVKSKRHARAFAFRARPVAEAETWRKAAEAMPGFGSPGLFSHDRIDRGSALLIEALPANLSGHAADFGCGWGALSMALLKRNPAIGQLDLIDIDSRALAAASANLVAMEPSARISTIWADIVAGDVAARTYDVIVMNPPFHAGPRAEPAIGEAFFQAASKALKPGGLLFAVANRKLPYEPVLKSAFRTKAVLFEGEGYKVIRAMR